MITKWVGDLQVCLSNLTSIDIDFPIGTESGPSFKDDPDLFLTFKCGSPEKEPPKGKLIADKKWMKLYLDNDIYCWHHNELGCIISGDIANGTCTIEMSETAFAASTDPVHQLIIPALAPLLAKNNYWCVHSCSFILDGTGVLVTGESTAGPTTDALQALAKGGTLLSDDMAIICYRNGNFEAWGVRSPMFVRHDIAERYGLEQNIAENKRIDRVAYAPPPLSWREHATLGKIYLLEDKDSGGIQQHSLAQLLSLTLLTSFSEEALSFFSKLLDSASASTVNRQNLSVYLA